MSWKASRQNSFAVVRDSKVEQALLHNQSAALDRAAPDDSNALPFHGGDVATISLDDIDRGAQLRTLHNN
ncbi:hypothetical protein K239x_22510 [Planctomycetes bacterium K23_9]|uniref:Uncharacterized protein n=1 Tax=Stieleria marina TaxID=1930275 RepID=A0A517NT52_9BACT|nr:hypothetical protein K239x_22510 [Planctomycetes bacterium K23_9]